MRYGTFLFNLGMKKHPLVSKLLGVTFEGYEQQVMALFAELEKKMLEKKKGAESTGKSKRKMIEGGTRELKQLQFMINYDGKSRKARGSVHCQKKVID